MTTVPPLLLLSASLLRRLYPYHPPGAYVINPLLTLGCDPSPSSFSSSPPPRVSLQLRLNASTDSN